MPELKWHWGYPVVVGIMVSTCLALYFSFRKLDWL
jgi:magnesium transporter